MYADGTHEARASASHALATRRPELTVLTSVRFFAAIEVVLLHTLFELGGDAAKPFPLVVELLTRGGLAVSFFFVLSGFVLTYTYCDNANELNTTPPRFWRARFARIYPLYFLGFLMDAPRVIRFFLSSAPSFTGAIGKIGAAGFAYVTLLQAWHPRVTNTWNTPGWSLSVEAFFYAVFPVLLALTKRWRSTTVCGAALVLWVLPILARALLTRLHIVDSSSLAGQTFWRSFPPFRLPEFALGVAAGRVFLSKGLEPHRGALRWWGIASLLCVLALASGARFLPDAVSDNTLGGPFFAVAILAAAGGAIRTPNWLNEPTLVLLGRASYAVYILHQPFKEMFLKVAHLLGCDSPSLGLLLAYLLVLQLVCGGLFLRFEDPMRRLILKARTP